MNRNNQNSYMREIRVKTMFLCILEHWRLIIAAALIFCVLGAGYKYYGLRKSLSGSDSAAAQEQYEKRLESYQTDRESYNKTIKKVQSDLEAKREYLNTSVLAEIDPYNEPIAQVNMTLLVSDVDRLANYVAAYKSRLNNTLDWTALSEKTGMEPRFLQELLVVSSTSNVITVRIRHSDPAMAREILEYVLELVPGWTKDISKSLGEHTCEISEINEKTIADKTMFTWLNTRINELNSLQTNLTKTQDAARKLVRPEVPLVLSKKSILMGLARYALAGLIGGALLVCILTALWLTFRNRVLSSEELCRVFGMRNIGVLRVNMKDKTRIDRALNRRWKELKNGATEKEQYEVISEGLKRFSGSGRKIVMTGDVSAERLHETAGKLSGAAGDYIIETVESGNELALRRAMQNADGAVLLEERARSGYANIERDVRLIRDWGSPLIGCICIY